MERKKIRDILKSIHAKENILVTSHLDPDGDSVCSELALGYFLEKIGKRYEILNQGEIPSRYLFLDRNRKIKCATGGSNDLFALDFKPDLTIVLECSHLERTGQVKKVIPKDSPIINLDHHPDNTFYGEINCVDPCASATGEIIYEILKIAKFPLDSIISTLFYVAILTDTGRFRFSNTTSRCLKICAELLKLGVDPRFITNQIYFNHSPNSLKLLGETLRNLELFSREVCFLTINQRMMKDFEVKSPDIEGFVDYSLFLYGIKIGALFLETKEGITKVSLRSQNAFDVGFLAKSFGGGGHKNAAGFSAKEPVPVLKEKVLQTILKIMEENEVKKEQVKV
jgi:bifunctional oligoribonuclease and PAP phosphatase NrnA